LCSKKILSLTEPKISVSCFFVKFGKLYLIASINLLFFKFNSDLRRSLYYRLRRRRQDVTNPNSKKWYDSNEFKSLFGIKTNQKEINGKNKVWYTSEN